MAEPTQSPITFPGGTGLPIGPTGPSSVPQFLTETPSGGLSGTATFLSVGVVPRVVTSTSDTILPTDLANYVTYNNSSAVAVTLPPAGSIGFANNFVFGTKNLNAGAVTITPTVSQIDGTATLVLNQNDSCTIYSDNTNYFSRCFAIPQMVLHAAYTNATTSFSTLGDGTRSASWAVAPNTDHKLECHITYNPSATTAGPKIQLIGPSAPTAVDIRVDGGTNATAYANATASAFSTPITAFGTTGAAPINLVLHITAGISNGANAGTVALQLAANGSGTLTVNAGGACRFQ